jgi:hypothetical protein
VLKVDSLTTLDGTLKDAQIELDLHLLLHVLLSLEKGIVCDWFSCNKNNSKKNGIMHKSSQQGPPAGISHKSSRQGPLACFVSLVFYLQMQFSPTKCIFSPKK